MKVATGLAQGYSADAHLAARAVAAAMAKADLAIAHSVLLFLTQEFARDPHPAILAASKAANCTQVMGVTAAGIFTDEDWILDSPAAVAMVLGDGVWLEPRSAGSHEDQVLSLAAPPSLDVAWLSQPGLRFGGVSGDSTGRGPFKVWGSGKIASGGRCDAIIRGAHGAIDVSQGIRALGAPAEVTAVNGHDLLALGTQRALDVLSQELPLEVRELERIPLHLLMAGVVFGEPATAVADGRFRLTPIIAANADDQSVTLSTRLHPGERLFWAVRQPAAAEHSMRGMLDRLAGRVETPRFGLFFPCMGRGPYFYGGVDRDLELVKERFPGMPVIGFYGNGEIGPLQGLSQLFQYSAVLGLFSEHV